MAVYCVSYDLNKAGQSYGKLYEELRKSPSWWHHLDSTWLIRTTENAAQLTERVRRHLDNNDTLLVIRVTRDYGGWLKQEAWDWINANIDY